MFQADFLDRPLLASRPIALHRIDHHALWLSPKALELTKKNMPSESWPPQGKVPGGKIVIRNDEATGQPAFLFLNTRASLHCR